MYDYLDLRQTERLKELVPYKVLAPDADEIIKELERLNNIIDTILEFSFFKEECPLNFGFGDKKETESQDIFYSDEYCENNCNDEYKKCWLKYFKRLQELKEENSKYE